MKKDFRREAKVLSIDLEVSPARMWGYGFYESKVVKVEQPPILLAFAWKWLGEKGRPHCLTLYDRKTADRYDDTILVKELWNLLDECQVAIAYNGKRFDFKIVNTFFIRHNMMPPRPYKVFDPIETARKNFRFDCNKLDYVGKLLVGEGKTEQTYGDCWEDLLLGKNDKIRKRAARTMEVYCSRDVAIMEKIYYKLLPWADNHPNMALMAGEPDICPRCGKHSEFKVKSYRRTGVQINAIQYQCSECHGYVTRKLNPEEREELDFHGKLKATYRNLTP